MIVRANKTYETNSLFPNMDWYNEGNYVIDETTEEGQLLAQKIIENYPYFNFVLDSEGNLIDITPTERPEPEPPIGFDPIDEEKLAMAEAIVMHEMEIQQLKAELAALKGE